MPGKRILIVEDEVVPEGWALEVILREAGYDVIGIAETREEAVAQAIRERPDLIIMDISLQGDVMAGVKAALEIQKELDTRIIYLTGIEVSESMLNEARKTRSFDFLTKPIIENQMLAAVSLAPLRRRESNLVFACYSHEDTDMLEEMYKFLKPLAEVGIDTWVDTKIEHGTRWKDEIEAALRQAKAAVLLVSIDFVTSRFIMDFELLELLKAAESRGTLILPVFVRYVPQGILRRYGLDKFQGINAPNDPLNTWEPSRREREGWGRLYEVLEEQLGANPDDDP